MDASTAVGLIFYIMSFFTLVLGLAGVIKFAMGDGRRGAQLIIGTIFLAILTASLPSIIDYISGGNVNVAVFSSTNKVVAVPYPATGINTFSAGVYIVNFGSSYITYSITYIDPNTAISTTGSCNKVFEDVTLAKSITVNSPIMTGTLLATIKWSDSSSYTSTVISTNILGTSTTLVVSGGNWFERGIAAIVNKLIGMLSKLGEAMFIVLPLPKGTQIGVLLTIMPTIDMLKDGAGNSVVVSLYGETLRIGFVILLFTTFLGTLMRLWSGDPDIVVNVTKDFILVVIWMVAGLYLYDAYASLMNAIIISLAAPAYSYIGTLFNGLMGLVSMLTMLGIFVRTAGSIAATLIFTVLIVGAIAYFRFLSIAAVVILFPIFAPFYMMPPFRGFARNLVNYIVNQSVYGIATGLVMRLLSETSSVFGTGLVAQVVGPMLLIVAPSYLVQLGASIASGSFDARSAALGVFDITRKHFEMKGRTFSRFRDKTGQDKLGKGPRGGGPTTGQTQEPKYKELGRGPSVIDEQLRKDREKVEEEWKKYEDIARRRLEEKYLEELSSGEEATSLGRERPIIEEIDTTPKGEKPEEDFLALSYASLMFGEGGDVEKFRKRRTMESVRSRTVRNIVGRLYAKGRSDLAEKIARKYGGKGRLSSLDRLNIGLMMVGKDVEVKAKTAGAKVKAGAVTAGRIAKKAAVAEARRRKKITKEFVSYLATELGTHIGVDVERAYGIIKDEIEYAKENNPIVIKVIEGTKSKIRENVIDKFKRRGGGGGGETQAEKNTNRRPPRDGSHPSNQFMGGGATRRVERKEVGTYTMKDIAQVLNKFEEVTGEEAYAVGGPVRDTLMGEGAKDIDIASPLPPEEVTKKFRGEGVQSDSDRA
ncbi:hypothetical protein [Pyrococcus kukulkanii]|uniref:hypothetical protein n=1 Tax=Pyrococcus kukulkanii TaxID=1609559 RepID=UPI00356370B4